ncbi:MAG: cytochrome c oxidase subunit I, partial [Actinobacteria bacterium]|nr:cytochrome c oxidase subunit I [Actinomycetota bacterium]
DYASQYGDWNLLISCFGFLLGAAQLIFLYNMVMSWRFGPRAEANPWRAKSIEWLVSSPPPRFNFDRIPRVVGGPYEYGVPGAVHALMGAEEIRTGKAKTAATAGAGDRSPAQA